MIKMKTTLKEIKKFYAKDISHLSMEECRKITKKEIIAYSCGYYGITGLVFVDIDGNYYKITKRNTNLFIFL